MRNTSAAVSAGRLVRFPALQPRRRGQQRAIPKDERRHHAYAGILAL